MKRNKKKILARNILLESLYLEGKSCPEIKRTCNFRVSIRQMQRVLAQMGIIRSPQEGFKLAMVKKRAKTPKN